MNSRRQRAATPLFVLPTGGGLGYGGFTLDNVSRRYFLDHLEDIPDALTRASALVVLWEEVLDSRVSPAEFLSVGHPRPSRRERRAERAVHARPPRPRFIGRLCRKSNALKQASALESSVARWLSRAPNISQKSAWFSAFRNIAQTPAGVEWLRRVWNREEKIEGLPLVEAR